MKPTYDAKLTKREQEILRYVSLGYDNLSIANILFISQDTVKAHLTNMRAKVGVCNRAALVGYAYETGLIVPAYLRTA